MSKKVIIIENERDYVEGVFAPKMDEWDIDIAVVPYYVSPEILDDLKPLVDDISDNLDNVEAIFVDLALHDEKPNKYSGFKVIDSLRQRQCHIPIIILSVFDEREVVSKGFLHDVDFFLGKNEFSDYTRFEFQGFLQSVTDKRKQLVKNVPNYYRLLTDKTPVVNIVSSFGHTNTSTINNLETEILSSSDVTTVFNNSSIESVIFFADLCNSVKIKEVKGFFDGLLASVKHNHIITSIIIECGGEVVKYIGDCVMARFDNFSTNAEVSVNCAIKIQEKLKAYNQEYSTPQSKIETKIGLASGRVLDLYTRDPHGPCVDLAARLESLASPGEICISDELTDYINISLIQSRIGIAEGRKPKSYLDGPHEAQLKGFSEPQKYRKVIWD